MDFGKMMEALTNAGIPVQDLQPVPGAQRPTYEVTVGRSGQSGAQFRKRIEVMPGGLLRVDGRLIQSQQVGPTGTTVRDPMWSVTSGLRSAVGAVSGLPHDIDPQYAQRVGQSAFRHQTSAFPNMPPNYRGEVDPAWRVRHPGVGQQWNRWTPQFQTRMFTGAQIRTRLGEYREPGAWDTYKWPGGVGPMVSRGAETSPYDQQRMGRFLAFPIAGLGASTEGFLGGTLQNPEILTGFRAGMTPKRFQIGAQEAYPIAGRSIHQGPFTYPKIGAFQPPRETYNVLPRAAMLMSGLMPEGMGQINYQGPTARRNDMYEERQVRVRIPNVEGAPRNVELSSVGERTGRYQDLTLGKIPLPGGGEHSKISFGVGDWRQGVLKNVGLSQQEGYQTLTATVAQYQEAGGSASDKSFGMKTQMFQGARDYRGRAMGLPQQLGAEAVYNTFKNPVGMAARVLYGARAADPRGYVKAMRGAGIQGSLDNVEWSAQNADAIMAAGRAYMTPRMSMQRMTMPIHESVLEHQGLRLTRGGDVQATNRFIGQFHGATRGEGGTWNVDMEKQAYMGPMAFQMRREYQGRQPFVSPEEIIQIGENVSSGFGRQLRKSGRMDPFARIWQSWESMPGGALGGEAGGVAPALRKAVKPGVNEWGRVQAELEASSLSEPDPYRRYLGAMERVFGDRPIRADMDFTDSSGQSSTRSYVMPGAKTISAVGAKNELGEESVALTKRYVEFMQGYSAGFPAGQHGPEGTPLLERIERKAGARSGYVTPTELSIDPTKAHDYLRTATSTIVSRLGYAEAIPRTPEADFGEAVHGEILQQLGGGGEEWLNDEQQRRFRDKFGVGIKGRLDFPYKKGEGIIDIKAVRGISGATSAQHYESLTMSAKGGYTRGQLSGYHYATGEDAYLFPYDNSDVGRDPAEVAREAIELANLHGSGKGVKHTNLMSETEMRTQISDIQRMRTGWLGRAKELSANIISGFVKVPTFSTFPEMAEGFWKPAKDPSELEKKVAHARAKGLSEDTIKQMVKTSGGSTIEESIGRAENVEAGASLSRLRGAMRGLVESPKFQRRLAGATARHGFEGTFGADTGLAPREIVLGHQALGRMAGIHPRELTAEGKEGVLAREKLHSFKQFIARAERKGDPLSALVYRRPVSDPGGQFFGAARILTPEMAAGRVTAEPGPSNALISPWMAAAGHGDVDADRFIALLATRNKPEYDAKTKKWRMESPDWARQMLNEPLPAQVNKRMKQVAGSERVWWNEMRKWQQENVRGAGAKGLDKYRHLTHGTGPAWGGLIRQSHEQVSDAYADEMLNKSVGMTQPYNMYRGAAMQGAGSTGMQATFQYLYQMGLDRMYGLGQGVSGGSKHLLGVWGSLTAERGVYAQKMQKYTRRGGTKPSWFEVEGGPAGVAATVLQGMIGSKHSTRTGTGLVEEYEQTSKAAYQQPSKEIRGLPPEMAAEAIYGENYTTEQLEAIQNMDVPGAMAAGGDVTGLLGKPGIVQTVAQRVAWRSAKKGWAPPVEGVGWGDPDVDFGQLARQGRDVAQATAFLSSGRGLPAEGIAPALWNMPHQGRMGKWLWGDVLRSSGLPSQDPFAATGLGDDAYSLLASGGVQVYANTSNSAQNANLTPAQQDFFTSAGAGRIEPHHQGIFNLDDLTLSPDDAKKFKQMMGRAQAQGGINLTEADQQFVDRILGNLVPGSGGAVEPGMLGIRPGNATGQTSQRAATPSWAAQLNKAATPLPVTTIGGQNIDAQSFFQEMSTHLTDLLDARLEKFTEGGSRSRAYHSPGGGVTALPLAVQAKADYEMIERASTPGSAEDYNFQLGIDEFATSPGGTAALGGNLRTLSRAANVATSTMPGSQLDAARKASVGVGKWALGQGLSLPGSFQSARSAYIQEDVSRRSTVTTARAEARNMAAAAPGTGGSIENNYKRATEIMGILGSDKMKHLSQSFDKEFSGLVDGVTKARETFEEQNKTFQKYGAQAQTVLASQQAGAAWNELDRLSREEPFNPRFKTGMERMEGVMAMATPAGSTSVYQGRLDKMKERSQRAALDMGLDPDSWGRGGGGVAGGGGPTGTGGIGDPKGFGRFAPLQKAFGGLMTEFSIGGAYFRMQAVNRLLGQPVQKWEQQGMQLGGAQMGFHIAMGGAAADVSSTPLGQIGAYQAQMGGFQAGLGEASLMGKAGLADMLAGGGPGYGKGRQLGKYITPGMTGLKSALGVGIGAGVIGQAGGTMIAAAAAASEASIAAGTGAIAAPAGAGLMAGVGTAMLPLALIAGTVVGGGLLAGEAWSSGAPENVQRELIERRMGYRKDLDLLTKAGMAMRGEEVEATLGRGKSKIFQQLGKALPDLPWIETGGSPAAGLAKQGGVEEAWEKYDERYFKDHGVSKGAQDIMEAQAYLTQGLDIPGVGPEGALRLGGMLEFAGVDAASIASGGQYDRLKKMSPMEIMGITEQGMSSMLGVSSALGVGPGKGMEPYLDMILSGGQSRAAFARTEMAAGVLGPIAAQAGITPSPTEIESLAQQIEQGAPTWSLQLGAQQKYGTLPIVQGMGLAPGSPAGQSAANAIATPVSLGQAQMQGQIAAQYGGLADIQGLTMDQRARYAARIEEERSGKRTRAAFSGQAAPRVSITPEQQWRREQMVSNVRGASAFGLAPGDTQLDWVKQGAPWRDAVQAADFDIAMGAAGGIWQQYGGDQEAMTQEAAGLRAQGFTTAQAQKQMLGARGAGAEVMGVTYGSSMAQSLMGMAPPTTDPAGRAKFMQAMGVAAPTFTQVGDYSDAGIQQAQREAQYLMDNLGLSPADAGRSLEARKIGSGAAPMGFVAGSLSATRLMGALPNMTLEQQRQSQLAVQLGAGRYGDTGGGWESGRDIAREVLKQMDAGLTVPQIQRSEQARRGIGGEAFGFRAESKEGLAFMAGAPTMEVDEVALFAQSVSIAGGVGQMMGMGPEAAMGLTQRYMGMGRQGVTPAAQQIIAQQQLGTGAVAQALGIPYGLGGGVEQQFAQSLSAPDQGRMTAQQYQTQAALIGYGQSQMGYSHMMTGYGLGPQALAARQEAGLPEPGEAGGFVGAGPIFGTMPGKGGNIYNIQQERQRRINVARSTGTGSYAYETLRSFTMPAIEEDGDPYQFAGGEAIRMGPAGSVEQAQRNLGTFQQVRGIREGMFDRNYNFQMAGIGRQEEALTLQFQQSMEKLELQQTMWQTRSDFQRREFGHTWQQMQQGQEWGREDMAYGRQMAGMQFGWQMEDFDRAIRFATGREKEQLIRQRGRAEETYTIEEGRRGTEEDRQETLWQQEEEGFARKVAHFEEMNALELQQFEMQKSHLEETYAMQMRHLGANKAHMSANYEDQKKINQLQNDNTESQLKRAVAQAQQEEKHAATMAYLSGVIADNLASYTGMVEAGKASGTTEGVVLTEDEALAVEQGLYAGQGAGDGLEIEVQSKAAGGEGGDEVIAGTESEVLREIVNLKKEYYQIETDLLDVLVSRQETLWGEDGVVHKGLDGINTLLTEGQAAATEFIERIAKPIEENGRVWKAWNGFIAKMIATIRRIKDEAGTGGGSSNSGAPPAWIVDPNDPSRNIPNPAYAEWLANQGLGGDAAGGRVVAGDARWVGERGAEVHVPQTSGQVISADSIAALFTGRAGQGGPGNGRNISIGSLTISVPAGDYTAQELGVAVREELERAVIDIADREDVRGEPW